MWFMTSAFIILMTIQSDVLGCGSGGGSGTRVVTTPKSQMCIAAICSGNSQNTLRGCDAQGCGYYGARRGSRTHNGVDIKCDPGYSVYSPFPASIVRRSNPYRNNNGAYNNGMLISGTGTWQGYTAKMWYFTPSKTRGWVGKGGYIGTSQSLPYAGITQHIHLEIRRNGNIVNPSVYIC